MYKRELTGIIIALSVLGVVSFTSSYLFYIFVTLVLLFAAYELAPLIKSPFLPSLSLLFLIFASIFLMPFYESNRDIFLFVISISVIMDSASYYFGKSIGSTKIFPETSPNKTLEGLIFGSLFSLISLYFVCFYQFFGFNVIDRFENNIYLVFLLAISILGAVLGDFLESKVKRHASIKDSGNLLPGHGGVLDRLDSQLLVLPLFFIVIYFVK
jgi:phosphatidate cytidylyltransferase